MESRDIQPVREWASRRGAALGFAAVVAAAALFVAYYAWLVYTLTGLTAAFTRRPLGHANQALLALGAAQAVAGLALALGALWARGGGDRRWPRRVYAAWLVLLAGVVATDRASGAYFDSAFVAAAYLAGAVAACTAGWLLATRRAAAP